MHDRSNIVELVQNEQIMRTFDGSSTVEIVRKAIGGNIINVWNTRYQYYMCWGVPPTPRTYKGPCIQDIYNMSPL